MAYRFRKSIKIAPGVKLNLGKKGGSISVGGRGGSVNFGRRGVHSNVGIPGSGLSYRSKIGSNKNTQPKSLRQSGSKHVEMKTSLALQEDGSITFKDAEGNMLSEDFIIQAKRQNRDFIIKWLEENCNELNQKIETLVNLHITTPPLDTEISFTPAVFDETQPIPPSANFPETKPIPPTLKVYGFLAKRIDLFQKLIDNKNHKLQQSYKSRLERWGANKAKFEADYSLKFAEYQEKLIEFNRAKNEFSEMQERRRKFIEEDRLTDPNAMQEFLIETFQTIVWPRETTISFEVIDNGKRILLDVDLPEVEDILEQQGVLSSPTITCFEAPSN